VPLHIDMGTDNNALYIESSDQFANIGLVDGSGSGKIIMDGGELAFTTGGNATTSFTNSAERMRIDSGGTVAVGTTDTHTWSTFDGRIRVGARGCVATTSGSTQVGHNWYYNGGYKYIGTGHATRMVQQDDGYISFENAPSGSADAAITFTERARITPSGGLAFNGDTAAANALDDYEEGTWTPIANFTSTTDTTHLRQVGSYTKIGEFVHCEIAIIFTKGNSAGSLVLDGFPFAVLARNSNDRGTGAVGYFDGTNAIVPLVLMDGNTSTRASLYDATDSSDPGHVSIQHGDFGAGAVNFHISITYKTAA